MRHAPLLLFSALTLPCPTGCGANLGIAPVLCSSGQPACPDGYECIEGPAANVCVRHGHSLDEVPASEIPHQAPAPASSERDAQGPAPANPDSGLLDNGSSAPSKDRVPLLDGAPVQPATGCLDEASEPNNSGPAATELDEATGRLADLEICYPGDVDLFAITLDVGDQLSVQVQFIHADGDLEAALLGPDGALLAERRSESDDEDFTLVSAAVAGSYLVAVWGFGSATNTYQLHWN